MKRVFFYSNININEKSSGIRGKVLNQVSALEKLGYDVYYSAYTSDSVMILNKNKKIKEKKFPTKNTKINKLIRRFFLIDFCTKYLNYTSDYYDFSYVRFHYFDPYFNKMLKELKKKSKKVVIEAHGYPYRTITPPSKLLLLTFFIDAIYEKKGRKNIDLVAAISNEKDIWGVNTLPIDNCVDVKRFEKLPPKIIDKNKIVKLVTASNERIYHDYPKLIKSLSSYYKSGGTTNYMVFFAGTYTESTKKLVKTLQLEEHVKFIGEINQEEINDFYKSGDLGIGSFGLHGGTDHGSSIKSKEFFAVGLPFINGWKEYSFGDDYEYVKRFDVFDELIDFNLVDEFIDNLNKKYLIYRDDMRRFAEENYTWESQLTNVIRELNNGR